MCGISGIYGFADKESAGALLKRMNDSIAHRGPDASGVYIDEMVALGHRRLSIIDTSADGNQPFYNSDKSLILVFNGEIYNYLELKEQLKSEYEFRTNSDSEVLLAAYSIWGKECLQRFNGMFAFVIWDKIEGELFIARDRMGEKPLYYTYQNKSFAFASEQRALLAGSFAKAKLASDHLGEYLAYQTVHSPASILEDVHLVPAAHFAVVTKNGLAFTEYWNPAKNSKTSIDSDTSAQGKIFDLLQSSVEMRMRSDVPFGAFLSGGIDSSAVVGLMSKIAPGRVESFSVAFYEKEFDESRWSSEVAALFGTKHHEIRVSANQFLELIPEALDAMDHPGGDGPNTYVVSKLTREAGIKMALSGLGGDELFAGYDVFRRMKTLEANKWLNVAPHAMRSLGGTFLAKMAPSVATKKIREILSLAEVDFANAYPHSRRVLANADLDSLIYQVGNPSKTVDAICKEVGNSTLPLLSKVSVAEMRTYMQNVLLRDADQMSMAHALEVRVPFLDHRLVEYVLSVPDNIKFPNTPKQLLVDSLKGLLPQNITSRKKMGFTFPWKLWMKNELRVLCETNLQYLNESGLFKPESIKTLWNRFLADDPSVTWSRLWHLVVLGHWMKKNGIKG